jgi:hypothetical protein
VNRIAAWVAVAWTLSGFALIAGEAASHAWWDVGWVLLLVLGAYAGLVETGGLARARVSASVALLVFGGMAAMTSLTGWPLGPLRFAGPEALVIANVVPLLPVLLAFALLALAWKAAGVAFPDFGVNALAGISAGIFLATLGNGVAFLAKERIWWLWNPWGGGSAVIAGVVGFLCLGLAAFFLARVFPEDTEMKLGRWCDAAWVLVAVNVLFAAANVALVLQAG